MNAEDLKTITVVSSAGSGNVFCQKLIKYNLKANLRWVNHDIKQADKNGINILIVRDPYKSIASALEIQFETFTEKEKLIFFGSEEFVNNKVEALVETYNNRLEHSKKFDYITPVSFELLTNQSDKFLEYISIKFQIPYLDTRLSADEVKKQLSLKKDLFNRVPRETTNLRKLIDSQVYKNKAVAEAYSEYIKYKKYITVN